MLQGVCTTEDCPYAHVKVDPGAPVCQEFVSGHCPRGVACTKKHLTPRMIRQLRQSKALQASVACIITCSRVIIFSRHVASRTFLSTAASAYRSCMGKRGLKCCPCVVGRCALLCLAGFGTFCPSNLMHCTVISISFSAGLQIGQMCASQEPLKHCLGLFRVYSQEDVHSDLT